MRMNRQILRLAVPNILSNLSVPMLGVVDTVLMGHQESVAYLGAIGLADVIFNVLYWSVAFLRMGVTGITAQAYGRKDEQESILTLGRGVFLGVLGGGLLIALQWPIEETALHFMETTPFTEELIRKYFGIRIFTAPATLALLALHGGFLGRQNSIFPMILTIGVNVLNLVGNLIFMKGFDMGIEGLAWGTLVAQYTGLVVACILFWVKYRGEFKHWSWQAFVKLKALGRFFEVNFALFLRGLILVSTVFFFMAESSHFDELTLSANQLFRVFLMIMAFGLDGFAYAAESLVGKFKGANDIQNMKKAIRYLFGWSLGLGALISAIYGLAGSEIMGWMTDKPEVVVAAEPYLLWVVVYTFISAIAFMWDGIYFGSTATWPLLILSLIAGAIFFGSYFLVREEWGNHGLWFSMVIFVSVRALGPTLTARRTLFPPEKK